MPQDPKEKHFSDEKKSLLSPSSLKKTALSYLCPHAIWIIFVPAVSTSSVNTAAYMKIAKIVEADTGPDIRNTWINCLTKDRILFPPVY